MEATEQYFSVRVQTSSSPFLDSREGARNSPAKKPSLLVFSPRPLDYPKRDCLQSSRGIGLF